MKIAVKSFLENLKSINNVGTEFVCIDCGEDKAFYMSTDNQAMKIPLDIEEVTDDEKKVYVINKTEFIHLVSYAKEFVNLNADYSYSANDGQIKGKFKNDVEATDDLDSIKVLFDNEDEYDDFMEVTPSIMSAITSGSIFVAPDSIKPSERFLDIQNSKVFSYSDYKIYMDDIAVEKEGLLSSEVIKSIQSLGIGTIVKSNNDSYLLTNAQRSIFEYFSIPNDVDFHPLFAEKFQKKLNDTKNFNCVKFNIDEMRSKLDYISFYANSNPNQRCFLNLSADNVSIFTDENNSVEIETVSIEKTEEFENAFIPLNCSNLQMIISKVGKGCENFNLYVSSLAENKLVIVVFGDTNETVILSKLNV